MCIMSGQLSVLKKMSYELLKNYCINLMDKHQTNNYVEATTSVTGLHANDFVQN
jgi:hypothetical protein